MISVAHLHICCACMFLSYIAMSMAYTYGCFLKQKYTSNTFLSMEMVLGGLVDQIADMRFRLIVLCVYSIYTQYCVAYDQLMTGL